MGEDHLKRRSLQLKRDDHMPSLRAEFIQSNTMRETAPKIPFSLQQTVRIGAPDISIKKPPSEPEVDQDRPETVLDIETLLVISSRRHAKKEQNGKSRKCLIYPDDNFRLVWDLVISGYGYLLC